MSNGKKTAYIAIEGNIGAGKTSLCKQISSEWSASLLLENFDENPFLPRFYENPKEHALAVELFFMTERHEQMKAWLAKQRIAIAANEYHIADYIFSKTLLFAQRNLAKEEWILFERLFTALNANIPQPDLLVYLHRPVEELLKNIKLRNRSYEQKISASYLKGIETSYFELFERLQGSNNKMPVLILDVTGADFVHNPKDYEIVKNYIQDTYPNGVNEHKALAACEN